MLIRAGADHIGEMQAWNLDTGKKVWTTKLPSQNWGPALATAGDVLFSGGTNDRLFRAFDARRARSSGSIRPSRASTACLCPSRSTASSNRGGVWLGCRCRQDAELAKPAVPR